MLIVGQPRDRAAVTTGKREDAIDVPDRALVPVKGSVGRGVAKGGDVLRKAIDRAACPGIDRGARMVQEMEKAFKVPIEDPVRNAMRGKGACELSYAGRRLTGFGDGGVDEEHNNLRNLTLDKTKESLPQKSAKRRINC